MKLQKLFLLLASCTLLAGCDISNKDNENSSGSGATSEEVDVLPINAKEYTIMIYMCGSNLESDYGEATANIAEMLSVNIDSSKINLIIETGGSERWKNYGISNNKLSRYHVEGNQLKLDTTLTNASMGDTDTFQSFMEWGLKDYPAKKTGVILWNHGGAMEGCCNDDVKGGELLNSEVKDALGKAFTAQNRKSKLEWIGYDCCLMQVADVASYNSQYFNYMVASQESEMGGGWDYDQWLPTLKSNTSVDTVTLLSKICDTFIPKNGAEFNDPDDNDGTLSVLDLSKMAEFDSKFKTLAANLTSVITTKSKFSNMFDGVMEFGYDDSGYYKVYQFDMHDAKGLFQRIESLHSGKGASACVTALDDLVVYHLNGNAASSACGLSIFGATTEYTKKATYSTSETPYSDWRTLNISYGAWDTGYGY
ncbi:MAG: hypothetical protein K6E11_02105 [Bacilli bacterium]|nr:hypothetical protein [Bacilli bacterium]